MICICNPHAGGYLQGTSGVGAGADDVQGLPFFLYILSTVKISRAKNPEGDLAPGDRTGGAPMWVRSMEGLGVVFTEAKHCHRAR